MAAVTSICDHVVFVRARNVPLLSLATDARKLAAFASSLYDALLPCTVEQFIVTEDGAIGFETGGRRSILSTYARIRA